MMNANLPDIDVGEAPDGDPSETAEWWGDALDALRDHMDDWTHAMWGSHSSMAPRYEMKDVEKSESVEVMENGSVTMKTRTWTEKEKVPVGEKKVCHGHYLDVEVTSESEKMAVIALADSAGLEVSERHNATRFTHRLEPA